MYRNKKCSLSIYLLIFSVWCFSIIPNALKAQNKSDSIVPSTQFSLGHLLYDAERPMPHYLYVNQNGERDSNDTWLARLDVSLKKEWQSGLNLTTSFVMVNDLVSIYGARMEFGNWQVNLGALPESTGFSHISMGDVGISNNARPLPQIGIRTKDYVNVPFTNGYFGLKGSWSHRWFEKNRFVQNTLLHEKSLYAAVKIDSFHKTRIFSGIQHYVQWGGTSRLNEELSPTLSDFVNVFFGRGASSSSNAGEQVNALGNHLGYSEVGLSQEFDKWSYVFSHKSPFEDEGSMRWVKITDYFSTISIDFKTTRNFAISKLRLEYLSMRRQGGSGIPDQVEGDRDNLGKEYGGRDNYYNNFYYVDGWTYRGRTIGNPLFLSQNRANILGINPSTFDWGIVNNRIKAFSLGLEAAYKDKDNLTFVFTSSSNYGTYAGLYEGLFRWDGFNLDPNFDYNFLPNLIQNNLLLTWTSSSVLSNLGLSCDFAIAVDFGDYGNSYGALVALRKNLF